MRSRFPCLDCTLPCTPPLHFSFLHSFSRIFPTVFLRNSFSLFSDRFSADCFLSCCFSEGILLILGCPRARRLHSARGRGCRVSLLFSHRFPDLVFISRFLLIFIGFWLPFGLHFLSFSIIFASLFRASISYRFFIDFRMDFASIFHHFGMKLSLRYRPSRTSFFYNSMVL